ncbi:MAG: hypothetical protein KGL39_16950 [Patescibacteria group bacterium]|nr:hypothetical protein [Patescibacteria group bacterium]
MATSYYSPAPLPYRPYNAPTASNPIGFVSNTNPVKAAQNQRQWVAGEGDVYQSNDEDLANQYATQQSGTQQYLDPIESALATGGGGYSPSEVSQIELTPQQQQNIATGAGISAGAGTASAVGSAQRAAAASGGNPAAMATYRARAAQMEGANAGDAMTQARIQAQQAGSQGAQTVGNARMNQQNQGLQYYGNLQAQQGQQAQSEQGLAQGAYGTEVGGTGNALGAQLTAAGMPTTGDKVIGAIGGALSSLADGTPDYLGDEGTDAVVGEDGPEMIVDNASNPKPNRTFMADGIYNYVANGLPDTMGGGSPLPISSGNYGETATAGQIGPVSAPSFGQRLGGALRNYLQGAGGQGTQKPDQGQPQSQNGGMQAAQSLGAGLGNVGKLAALAFLADGTPSAGPKIVTSPTRVKLAPGDQVIPLSYRPKAKIRPSAALPAINAMRQRPMFGAQR